MTWFRVWVHSGSTILPPVLVFDLFVEGTMDEDVLGFGVRFTAGSCAGLLFSQQSAPSNNLHLPPTWAPEFSGVFKSRSMRSLRVSMPLNAFHFKQRQ